MVNFLQTFLLENFFQDMEYYLHRRRAHVVGYHGDAALQEKEQLPYLALIIPMMRREIADVAEPE